MNYKRGDLVKITGNCNYHDFNIGETVKLRRIAYEGAWIAEHNGHSWCVRESDMKPFKPAIMPQKIVITTDGKTTLARLFDGKKMVKRAEAKCAPSDVFDFSVGAELAIKRLIGEKSDMGNPITEPITESKPEPVKLYCVKSFMDILSAGNIYESDEYGHITYNDGRKSSHHVSDPKFDFVKIGNLAPLVRRPAKVGEWVYVSCDSIGILRGEISKVIRDPGYVTGRVYVRTNKPTTFGVPEYGNVTLLDTDEYLVLDGYHGDPA